jgi:hypothetical protein
MILNCAELSRYMQENPAEFYGRAYKQNTISNKASQMTIPAQQHGIRRGGIVAKVIEDGKYTFDTKEISEWCRLGANKAAVYRVLRARQWS